jgi:predicted amidohydrolase
VGAIADVAVLELERGTFELMDSEKETLMGESKLVCKTSVKDGKVWWSGT